MQEEAGWRGVLTDNVQPRIGALGASLIVGAVWGLWHLPLLCIPREDIYCNQLTWGLVVCTMLLSVLITRVYTNTRSSLFAAMLMHASWNRSNDLFAGLHSDTGGSAFLARRATTVALVVAIFGPGKLMRTRAKGPDLSTWRPGRV